MSNKLLIYAAAIMNVHYMSLVNAMNQTSYIRKYKSTTTSNILDGTISTIQISKKNALGAYPWEIAKPYGNAVYFLYGDYFRIGGKVAYSSKMYHYLYGLNCHKRGIICRLINPIDYKKVIYFSIDNVLSYMSTQIDRATKKNSASLPKLLYYRQIVLDLQKESLDFQQSVLNMVSNPL